MADKPAGREGGGGRGRGGGGGRRGKGGGGGRGGRGGRGRGNKDGKAGEGGEGKGNNQNQQQQAAKGGGRGGGDKGRRRRNNNNNKGGKGSGGNKGGGGKGQAPVAAPAPPPKSEAAKKQEEEERIAKQEADALRKAQEAKQKAIEAALESRRKEQEAVDSSVKEAMDCVKAAVESVQQHKVNRAQLAPDDLAEARKKFQSNKKSLKTDLKKCTAFVKKVKSGSAWSMKPEEINRDVSTLNLSRYVDEVVAALLDAKLKLADLPVVVALSIAMHLRYDEFLSNLLPGLWGVINGKATEETARNRRLYVRLITDFVLNGLVTDTKQLVNLIADATGGKGGSYAVTDANLIVAFGKAAGYEIFGKRPRSIQAHIELIQKEAKRAQEVVSKATAEATTEAPNTEDMVAPTSAATIAEKEPVVIPLALATNALAAVSKVDEAMTELAVTNETSDIFTNHCMGAYKTLSTSLAATHVKLQKLEKRCEQDRLLSGTLPEAREKGLSDARKLLESLQKSVDTFSDVLDQPLPELEEEDNEGETDAAGGGLELWTKGGGDGENGDFGPFDDEETRAFYCDIPDLLTTVPPGLLGISTEEIERRKAENLQKYGSGFDAETVEDEAEAAGEEVYSSEDQLLEEEEAADGEQENNGGDEGEENKDTPHYKLTVLLEQELPECNRREQIDEIAEKFCTNNGSSKNSRKRLSRTLFLVPRTRLDLLPYYSRMTAILDRVWPDIAPPLVKDLEQQFHGQTKFKKNQNIESRFKTARYIGELTKFRVAPPIVALRCIKRCCDDFTGANIDVACCLLESCGRYLHRVKHTNPRMTQLLDTITRLSKAAHLDERAQSLIKAAFYTVKPPHSGPRKQAKEYSPLEAYLRHLLMVRLEPDPNSVSFVSKQIIRFPWNDPSKKCGPLVCNIMLKTCRKGRYNGIQALAAVAANLRRHRPEVSIRLIDSVLEELRWAIEHPNFRDQQRIISYARLLGELFCVSLVSGQLIIQQLYNFLNFGHEIPAGLKEASEKHHQETMAAGAATAETSEQLPVYNSAGGSVPAINEDEEMDEAPLETKEDEEVKQQQPVAVSKYSEYDPRVPSPEDPPNSAFRVKLVCTLLEVVAKSLVARNNIPKLQGFMAAFQRYLFTKTSLPTEVEFALLDTFDIVDSMWRKATKEFTGKGAKAKKEGGGDADAKEEQGFLRYPNWLEAHNATVAAEEADYLVEARTRARIEVLAGESTAEHVDGMDGELLNDDESDDEEEDDDDSSADPMSLSAKDSVTEDHHFVIESGDEDEGDDNMEMSQDDETSDDDSGDSDDSDGETDDDDRSDEDEFDEEAYIAQMEEEAFERELRRVTMEALEKGKVAARSATGGKVADTMPSGSQIIKKKPADVSRVADSSPAGGPTLTLGGGAGILFQLLKKGHKGKLEAKELIVPTDTNLAKTATKQDDEAARERDMIKARVLQYEAESAEARQTGGNVYLEQEKLQVIRNRPLSMDDIDRNFGTSGGNLRPNSGERSRTSPSAGGRGGMSGGRGGRGGRGRGRGNASGRSLY